VDVLLVIRVRLFITHPTPAYEGLGIIASLYPVTSCPKGNANLFCDTQWTI